jgi:hypothetical protein
MDFARAWPLAVLYLATVCGLLLAPSPRSFVLEASPPALPAAPIGAGRGLSPEQAQLADVKLDINAASVAELVALPDIGERLARAIVEARRAVPLRCESALLRLLGPGRLARLRPFLKPLPKSCRNPDEGVK